MSRSNRKTPSRRAAYIASTFRSLAATGAGLLSLASVAKAVDYQYTGGGAGTAAVPVSGLFSAGFVPTLTDGGGTGTDRLIFGGAPTANLIATDDFTLAITTNAIQFNNTTAFTYTLARGGAGTSNLINLAGSNPYISFSNTVAGSQVIDNLDHAFLASGFITKTTNPNNGNANPIMNGALSLGANAVTVALLDTGGDASAELTINGPITGTGPLTLNSTVAATTAGSGTGNVPGTGVNTDSFGTLLISANNSAFSGAVNITKGRLIVNNDNALGTGLITVGGAAGTLPNTGDGGVLALGGNQSGSILYGGLQGAATGFTLPNTINLGGEVSGGRYGIGLFNNSGSNTLSGVTTLTLANVNIQINNLSALTFSQPLVQGVAGAGVTKSGSGLLVLNNDTGTALKTISVGNLDFTGTPPTAASSVTLSAGAALNVGQANDAFPTVQSALSSGVINTASAGSVAITGNNAETINFTGYATLGLGATAAGANYSGALTPNGTNYRLGGGGGTLTISGTNTLTGANSVQVISGPVILAGANNFSGGLTLTNNTLTLGAAGDIGTTGTITFNGGTLQFTAADTTDYSSRFSTAGAQAYNLDTNGQNVTLATGFTSTGGQLDKLGAGTLTLGNGTTTTAIGTGSVFVEGGTLTIANGVTVTSTNFNSYGRANGQTGIVNLLGTGTLTTTSDLNISDVANSNGLVNLQGTGLLRGNIVYVGKGGTSTGVVNITGGGTLTSVNGDFRVGGGGGTGDNLAVGIINLSNGAVNAGGNFQPGAYGKGEFNLSGGTFTQTGGFQSIGRFATAFGTVDLSGGAYNFNVAGNRLIVGETGAGVLNVRGGLLTNTSTSTTIALTLGNDNVATSVGQVNLLGGTLNTASVGKNGAAATGTFNFNGGTLQARLATATFMTGLTNAYVYPGGAIIDTNNFALTIGQNLLAPTGSGVTGITATGGTGYTAPPIVQITGGGGFGATAVAVINNLGALTGFIVTNPGVGYTAPPTVTLYNAALATGGAVATGVTATTGANSSGGLTKVGPATLTLTGASTYTGATIVNQGTLAETFGAATTARLASTSLTLGGTGFDGSSNGSTFALTGTTTASTASTQNFTGGTLIRQGGTSITTTNGVGTSAVNLGLGAITRNVGSIVNFTPATTGTISTTNTGTNGILGGWAIENANTFAAVSGGVITPLATANYGTNYATADATTNFDAPTGAGTFTNTAANVFRYNTVGAATSTLNGAYSLTSGGILVTTTVGANTTTITGGTSLTSGNGQDIAISQQNTGGALVIATPITGAIGLTKGGGGELTLTGANDYTGATTIFNGFVDVNSATALGSASTGTNVYAAAYAAIGNGISTAEPFTINGAGLNGALTVLAGNSGTATGNVTLGSVGATATSARSGAAPGGLLTINGVVQNGTATGLDVAGGGGGALVAPVSNTVGATTGLVINGATAAGTLVLGGANTYTGITSVIRGNLIVDGTAGGAINTTSDINVAGSGSTEAAGITVRNGGLLATTGNINVANSSASPGAITLTGGTIRGIGNTNGNLFIGNTATAASTSYFNMSGGTVDVSGAIFSRTANATVNVLQTGGTISSRGYYSIASNGPSTENLTGGTINVKVTTPTAASATFGELEIGVFGGGVGTFNQAAGTTVTLNNNATLVLGSQGGNAGANTYNQNGGTVSFYSDNTTTLGGTGSLVLGRNGVSGAEVYNLNGGTLTVPTVSRGTATGSGTLALNGGTLRPAQSDNPGTGAGTSTFISGTVATTVGNGGAIVATNGFNATIATPLTPTAGSTGGLTKTGLGQLNLTSNSTYTGTTVVNGGTLNVDNGSITPLTTAGNLSATSGITVNTTGTLLLSGVNTVNNRLNDSAPVALGGGTFRLAGVAEGTGSPTSLGSPGTNAPGVGALTLTGDSIIDLQGTSVLHFAASGSADPNASFGALLSIYNWSGTPTTGGGMEQLLFGSSDTNASLTAVQLGQISFYSDSGTTFLGTGVYAGQMDGEVVPGAVPEPATWLAGALMVGMLGFSQRRRVSAWLGLVRPV